MGRERLRFILSSLSTSYICYLSGKSLNWDVGLAEVELCQNTVKCFKIYGARKKKKMVKCQGYFITKEKMGFPVNINLIKYRNTSLGNRLQSVSSASVCFKCRYTSLQCEDGTERASFISPALVARLS